MIITLTVDGIIAPVIAIRGVYGIDYGGFFGPPGATIAGLPFSVTWTGIDCNCVGSATFNPVIDAVLTINNHSYDFGAGIGLGNDFSPEVQQVEVVSSGQSLTTWASLIHGSGGYPDNDGVFYIPCCSNTIQQTTQAYFLPVAVPAPIMGTGLEAFVLILALASGLLWRHQRRVQ